MGIDYSSTGINHVWDFSGLVPESQIGVSYNGMSGVSFLVNVIFGSFAASQYQATYFVANNDLPIDQLGAFLPVNVTDIYQFSKKMLLCLFIPVCLFIRDFRVRIIWSVHVIETLPVKSICCFDHL